MKIDASRCPICAEPNNCQLAAGRTQCWCFELPLPVHVVARVPVEALGVACVCEPCATRTERRS